MGEQYSIMEPEGPEAGDALQDVARVHGLAGREIELPSPPGIVVRILKAVRDDNSCFAELGRIIAADPALAARLLKVANSSIYGFGGRIKSIENALALLGINSLKNIALSFIIVRQMQGRSDGYFDFQYFWKRSVTAAVAARLLAPLADHDSDDAFVGGLLQDIGVLVFFHHCTDSYMEVLALKNSTAAPGHHIEQQLLGLSHARLGGALLRDWGLPESICLPVSYHHLQDGVPERYRVAVDILDLADRISAIYHGGQSSVRVAEVLHFLAVRYGLSENEARELIDSVAVRTNEVMEFFEISGGIRPLSHMLQDANRELARLNCSYEQLVMELKQAREDSSQYVSKLIEANKKFREMAYRDELTDLFNHRYFQEVVESELARAKRYGHELSLLFFDIDYFKQINDNFGHLAGDHVLQQVAARLRQSMRASDTLVRYGGDEFAVIMPETGGNGAEILAERIRRDIEELRITVDEAQLRVTVSLGGAAVGGTGEMVDKLHLVKAADNALYQAKRNGRNCVSVARL